MQDTRNTLGDEDMTADEAATFSAMLAGKPLPEPKAVEDDGDAGGEADDVDAAVQAAADDIGEHAEGDDAKADNKDDPAKSGDRPRDKGGRFAKTVPHAALHAEREEHKKTRAQLQDKLIQEAKLSERLQVLMAAFAPPEPTDDGKKAAPSAAQPPAKPEEDLLGTMNWQNEQLKRIEENQKKIEQDFVNDRKTREEHSHEVQTVNRYMGDLKSYADKQPEFQDAMRHVIAVRHATLESEGVTDLAQRNQIIAQEERALVKRAYADGVNPAERLHKMAVAYGFKKPDPAAAAAKPSSSAAVRIENVNRGMKTAGASLSNVGGTSGESNTAQQIANMDEEEFAAFVDKMGPKNFKKKFLGAS